MVGAVLSGEKALRLRNGDVRDEEVRIGRRRRGGDAVAVEPGVDGVGGLLRRRQQLVDLSIAEKLAIFRTGRVTDRHQGLLERITVALRDGNRQLDPVEDGSECLLV